MIAALRHWILTIAIAYSMQGAEPIVLMGTNGRTVQFAGVLEAKPQGLVLLMEAGAAPITVAWDRFDLMYLEEHQNRIYEASVDALSYQKAVALNLGIYAEYLTYKQAVGGLAQAFGKEESVPVPSFHDYLDAYNRSYQKRTQDYEDYAQDRGKIFSDYEGFVRSYFAGKGITLSASHSSWSGNVFSASPSQDTVRMSAIDMLRYFADENNRYRREALIYVQNYPELLNRPIEILGKLEAQVPSPLFDKGNADEIYLETLIENNIRELEHMRDEKSFPHTALRNFEKLLGVLDSAETSH